MVIKYKISISEIKALMELLQELCKRSGLDETVTRSIFKKLNERDFK